MATTALAQEVPYELSEEDFLSEIPQIYSASRLPQKLEDAAGASTVLDREFIRLTGARDLTEVFRWMPGFQVATSAGGRSVVAYHGLSGQISQRMQVYVDGRSVYAPYLFGGIDWSSLSVPLDEIERIEIQRGSNSVTYGANAFLGVIHIITRTAAQSVGIRAQLTQGNNGIADRYVRIARSHSAIQWRIAGGQRSGKGLESRPNAYRTDYLDVRAEIQPSDTQDFSLTSGLTRSRFGSGFEARPADPLRNETAESGYIQARYRHAVDPGQEWSLSLSTTRDRGDDSFEIPLLDQSSLSIDGDRRASRYAVDYQHFNTIASDWRASWGAGYRRQNVVSSQLFNTIDEQTNASWFGYVNAEWQPNPHWVLNFGSLMEKNGLAKEIAPRLSINWKPTTAHTFKVGYSSAFRAPSIFEQRADWRIENDGKTLDIRYLSSGGLVPEKVKAWDIVYLGNWREQGITLDARIFREKLSRLITSQLSSTPSAKLNFDNDVAYDLRNNAQAENHGMEYQLSWRPRGGTLVSVNQYFGRPSAEPNFIARTIPRRSTGVILSHGWSNGWTAGLGYASVTPMSWLGESTSAGQQRLLSLRVGRSFSINGAKADISATLRRPIGISDEFRERQQLPKQFWISVGVDY